MPFSGGERAGQVTAREINKKPHKKYINKHSIINNKRSEFSVVSCIITLCHHTWYVLAGIETKLVQKLNPMHLLIE